MNKWFLFLAVVVLFYQSFDNPVFFDSHDAYYLWSQAGPDHQIEAFKSPLNRSVTILSFSLLRTLPLYWHNVINVLLHFLNSVLLFYFLKSFYSEKTSRFVSAFFALNPASLYTVCYLVQRSQLLMMFFGLLMCLSYIQAMKETEFKSLVYFALSIFALKFACTSKSVGIVFIAVIPLLSVIFRNKLSLWYNLFFVMLGGIIASKVRGEMKFDDPELYRTIIENSCAIFKEPDIYFKSILTQAGLFFQYFAHWLLPLPSSIDMKVPFQTTLTPLILFCAFALISTILFIVRKTRFLGFGLLLSVLFFLPEFTRSRIGEMFVLYRSYIWALGYMISLGWFIERVRHKAVLLPIIPVLFFVTFVEMKQFESERDLWVRAADMLDLSNEQVACQSARAFNNAGSELIKNGEIFAAERYFRKATELNKSWLMPVSNLGVTNFYLGDFEEAKELLTRVMNDSDDEGLKENAARTLNKIQLQM